MDHIFSRFSLMGREYPSSQITTNDFLKEIQAFSLQRYFSWTM